MDFLYPLFIHRLSFSPHIMMYARGQIQTGLLTEGIYSVAVDELEEIFGFREARALNRGKSLYFLEKWVLVENPVDLPGFLLPYSLHLFKLDDIRPGDFLNTSEML